MPRKQDSISITSANEPLSQDQARRTKVYLFQMGTRVACFAAAVFIPGPLRWVLIAMAVILPYIAVVKVNLGRANNLNMDNPMEYLQLEAEHNTAQRTPTLPTDPNSDLKSDSQEPHNG